MHTTKTKQIPSKESHSSNLSTFGYRIHLPSTTLAPYIRCYWEFRPTPLSKHHPPQQQRFVSDGGMEWIFRQNPPSYKLYAPDQTVMFQKHCILGPLSNSVESTLPRRYTLFGIRFHPGALQHILQCHASEIRDSWLELEELCPPTHFTTQFFDTMNDDTVPIHQKIEAFERRFLQKLETKEHPDLHHGLQLLSQTRGEISIKELSQQLRRSPRHIRRVFQQGVGLSPKQLSRIYRFHRIFEHSGITSWSQLALQCGFYDQAHLINEFKSFTGMSPQQFFDKLSPNLLASFGLLPPLSFPLQTRAA